MKACLNVSAALPAAPRRRPFPLASSGEEDSLVTEDFFKSRFARVILKKKGNAKEILRG